MTTPRNFVTCHCHVASLDSASTPTAFAERELELNTGYMTATDHGSLAACRQVYDLAKDKGLTPILGLEGYFRDDNCPIFEAAGIPKTRGKKRNGQPDLSKPETYVNYFKYAHFTTHFLDQAAYEVAVRLLSKADERAEQHGQERKPLFGWEQFEELAAANTTITTGCLIGMVQRHLVENNDPHMAMKYFDRMRATVPKGHLYIEIFPHHTDRNWVQGVFLTLKTATGGEEKVRFHDKKKLRTNVGEIEARKLAYDWALKGHAGHHQLLGVQNWSVWEDREPAQIIKAEYFEGFMPNECRPWCPDGDLQKGTNEFMLYLARKYDVPILIGDDSHFAHAEEKPVQDVRLMASGGSWRFYSSYHRQSSAEAMEHFRKTLGTSEVEFEKWVDSTYEWASKFNDFRFETKPSLPTKFYPQDTMAHTMALIRRHGRMQWKNPAYVQRLASELELLHKNGTVDLLPYFFLDEEVCSVYREKGLITGPGRGSAAGLLLTYLLGITHVDPLKYDLSMERFLTLDRIRSGKLPDIDQDLQHRDLLEGWEEDGIEVTLEDGSTKIVPKNAKVVTEMGIVTVREAYERKLEIQEWA